MIEENKQFKKWRWINVRIEKSRTDQRPQSYKVYIDVLSPGATLTTPNA